MQIFKNKKTYQQKQKDQKRVILQEHHLPTIPKKSLYFGINDRKLIYNRRLYSICWIIYRHQLTCCLTETLKVTLAMSHLRSPIITLKSPGNLQRNYLFWTCKIKRYQKVLTFYQRLNHIFLTYELSVFTNSYKTRMCKFGCLKHHKKTKFPFTIIVQIEQRTFTVIVLKGKLQYFQPGPYFTLFLWVMKTDFKIGPVLVERAAAESSETGCTVNTQCTST